jgi:hypothetical protein
MFHDQPDDAEGERTITLRRKDISAARRLLNLLLGAERKSFDDVLNVATRPVEDTSRSALVARAREEFQDRRRRAAVFGHSMFGEAAWDLLLVLYILDMSGQRQTVGSLLQFSGSPLSTAKRWLDYLTAHGLVQREAHPTDRRTFFVSLTGKGREKLDLYYSETVETGV